VNGVLITYRGMLSCHSTFCEGESEKLVVICYQSIRATKGRSNVKLPFEVGNASIKSSKLPGAQNWGHCQMNEDVDCRNLLDFVPRT
jgi:hypothetical protein